MIFEAMAKERLTSETKSKNWALGKEQRPSAASRTESLNFQAFTRGFPGSKLIGSSRGTILVYIAQTNNSMRCEISQREVDVEV